MLVGPDLRAYDGATVKSAVALFALSLLCCMAAQGQVSGTQSRRSTPVSVRGQIHAPGGGPLQEQIRIQLIGDDPTRPPEYYFSDSNGRFVFPNLLPDYGYEVVIEGSEKKWGTTRESFIILGTRFVLTIHLRPPERAPSSSDPSVSVSKLKQDVPRAARKEYDNAIESMNRGEQTTARQQLEHAIELFPDTSKRATSWR